MGGPGERVEGQSTDELLRFGLDVRLVVDLEGPHKDAQPGGTRRVLRDRERAQPTSFELLTLGALDRAGREQVRGVVGQVPEVNEAPERELWRAPVQGVRHHLAGKSE